MILVCHVILQDYVIKGSRDFIVKAPYGKSTWNALLTHTIFQDVAIAKRFVLHESGSNRKCQKEIEVG